MRQKPFFSSLFISVFSLIRKLVKGFVLFVLFTAIATTLMVFNSGEEPDENTAPLVINQDGKNLADELTVNDITGLNPITVAKVVKPARIDDITSAITSTTGPISIGGGRYSQGGQIAYPDSLHLDMRSFNQVLDFDASQKVVTVQAGISWRELQQFIDKHDLSIKIMQTYANFTVGGSLSVNVHGRYIGEGPLVRSVISLKLILANGDIVIASPEQNSELFYGVIGGYGGLAVIAEATLKLMPNVKVERETSTMGLSEYYPYFKSNIRNNKAVVFHNGDIYPPDYENIRNVSWLKTDQDLTQTARLIPRDQDYGWQPKVADFVAGSDFGKWVRQYIFDPLYYSVDAVQWRNYEASYDVNELEPDDRAETTYALREYFVPVDHFDSFAAKMKTIFIKHQANIINVSIRHALPDPGTLLAWADKEVFAFVVYYRQGTSLAAREKVKAWSKEIIDAVIEEQGSYYLPYQIHASNKQFKQAYPRADEYFALKDKLDPNNRFRNKLMQAYYPKNKDKLAAEKAKIGQYYRDEGQTLLTIPEWYLVFNPLEYADFIGQGHNPSDFPFFASITEYWSLYDKVVALADSKYPKNDEYMTMLQVIGISTTMEYMYKGAYENSIGRFTHWTASDITPEDIIISDAHRAYSELIFDQAWYEFDFGHWLNKIWWQPDFFGENFIRKLERKLFFTLEFGFKDIYAAAIKSAAKATYEKSDGNIYLVAHSEKPSDVKPISAERVFPGKVLATYGEKALLSTPRWGGFTTLMPKLAKSGLVFDDISGNQEIALSFITSKKTPFTPTLGRYLFESKLVSLVDVKRVVYTVSVADLAKLLNEISANGHKIEHIYDY